jgi:antirestriction protein ArdC
LLITAFADAPANLLRRADRVIPLDPAAALTAAPPLIGAGLDGLQAQPGFKRRKPMKTDLYNKVTDQIITSLEQGVRPWMKPWSAEHAAGGITRPLRANGIPYQGINVLALWSDAVLKGYSAPIWMTFRQALELDAHVRKGESGSTVVYASKITRTGTDADTGEVTEATIPFLKSYTVFNVEQIEGLPAHFHAMAEPRLDPVQRIERAETFFAATRADIRNGGNMAYYNIGSDFVQCRLSKRSAMPRATTPYWRMNAPTGRAINPALGAIWGARSASGAPFSLSSSRMQADLG